MQAQGWAYIDTEHTSYGETYGLSPRLLSPSFLAKYGATRETIEGSELYTKVEFGKPVNYKRDRVEDFPIDWEEIGSDESEIIYL